MSTSLHPLASVTGVLAVLNNIFLLSAPWIASPTKPRNGQPATQGLSPIMAAMIYAIWQPICLVSCMWTGVPMWLGLLFISGPHLQMSTFINNYWYPKMARKAREEIGDTKTTDDHDHSKGRRKSLLDHVKSVGKSGNYWWIPPISSAAASDAGLILFAAELTSYPDAYTDPLGYHLAFPAMLMYLVGRFADYFIAITTNRRGIYAFDSYTWRERLALVGLLAILFVVRAGFAWILEQFCDIPVLSLVLWPKNVEIVLDRSKLEWFRGNAYPKTPLPWWLSPLLAVVSIPLQIFCINFLQRAARED